MLAGLAQTLARAAADPVGDRIAAAARHLQAGHPERARAIYAEILEAAPAHPLAIAGLATLASMGGQSQRAFDLLAAGASVHPNHPVLLAQLGDAQLALGRAEEAGICLERSVALAPEEPAYRINWARALLALGRTAEALAQLQEALARDPAHAVGHLQLANLLIGLRSLPGAERHLRAALDADPALAEARHNLALVLKERGRLVEALAEAEAAYLDDPGRPAFLVTLSELLAETGRLAEGQALIKRCLALAPHDLDAVETGARLALMAGETDAALGAVAAPVRRAPKDPEAVLVLARTLAAAGRIADALKAAEEALRLKADHPNAVALRTRLRLALGRFRDAWPETADAGDPADEAEPVAYALGPDLTSGEAVLLARFLAPSHRPQAAPAMLLVSDEDSGILLSHVAGLDVRRRAAPAADEGAPASSEGLTIPDGIRLLRELPRRRPWSDHEAPWSGPYLAPRQDYAEGWARSLADLKGARIGLFWGAGSAGPSLSEVAACLPEVATGVSLQTGPLRADLAAYPGLLDAGRHLRSAADLVALVAALDAVITADALPAHLAGALGKPGVVVVPDDLPWCWAHREGCSLWYPTLAVVPLPLGGSARSSALDRARAALSEEIERPSAGLARSDLQGEEA